MRIFNRVRAHLWRERRLWWWQWRKLLFSSDY